MSTVYIPAPLRRLTGGVDHVEVPGTTVGELIDALDVRHPGLREALLEDGELSPHIAVSIDGILGSAGVAEPVEDESEVHFVPPLGGG